MSPGSHAEAIDSSFWSGRRVFITGHTGFKGAWTSLVLQHLGASVFGYALPPQTESDLFNTARVLPHVAHQVGDICDLASVTEALVAARPDIVIHMAAQALVQQSYAAPVETYAVNVMGTVNLLEAVRRSPAVKAVVVVTSDKCYDDSGVGGHREGDALGGYDPYASSKACAELVAASFRRSFLSTGKCRLATARAGNVVGGGDWARHRLVPDAIRAFSSGQPLRVRHPTAVRPWQHVLEPVAGYLLLAHRLARGEDVAEAWNFGPDPAGQVAVGDVVEKLSSLWGEKASWTAADASQSGHETASLTLDCTKARTRLGWIPKTDIDEALGMSVAWYHALRDGHDMREFTLQQIKAFLGKR